MSETYIDCGVLDRGREVGALIRTDQDAEFFTLQILACRNREPYGTIKGKVKRYISAEQRQAALEDYIAGIKARFSSERKPPGRPPGRPPGSTPAAPATSEPILEYDPYTLLCAVNIAIGELKKFAAIAKDEGYPPIERQFLRQVSECEAIVTQLEEQIT